MIIGIIASKKWSSFFENRPVLHRVHLRPGDPTDDKMVLLGQIYRRVCLLGVRWNWSDNPRRAEMHKLVKAYYECERALAAIEEHEKENQEAVDAASYHSRSDGVSAWFRTKRIPREVGLIPIPPEFKEIRKRMERAQKGDQRQRVFSPVKDAGPVTRFLPEGFNLPELKLEGTEVKDWNWSVDKGRQREQQQKGRSKGRSKGGGNQQGNQQHNRSISITLPDED